jgi:hypothetical protein
MSEQEPTISPRDYSYFQKLLVNIERRIQGPELRKFDINLIEGTISLAERETLEALNEGSISEEEKDSIVGETQRLRQQLQEKIS